MNTPHIHAELIHAWADGAQIQSRPQTGGEWFDAQGPSWYKDYEYRIKPQTKPDFLILGTIQLSMEKTGSFVMYSEHLHSSNVKFTFDGETNELKAVEIVK